MLQSSKSDDSRSSWKVGKLYQPMLLHVKDPFTCWIFLTFLKEVFNKLGKDWLHDTRTVYISNVTMVDIVELIQLGGIHPENGCKE